MQEILVKKLQDSYLQHFLKYSEFRDILFYISIPDEPYKYGFDICLSDWIEIEGDYWEEKFDSVENSGKFLKSAKDFFSENGKELFILCVIYLEKQDSDWMRINDGVITFGKSY